MRPYGRLCFIDIARLTTTRNMAEKPSSALEHLLINHSAPRAHMRCQESPSLYETEIAAPIARDPQKTRRRGDLNHRARPPTFELSGVLRTR